MAKLQELLKISAKRLDEINALLADPKNETVTGLLKVIDQVWPKSLRIRCWVHKMRNIKAKLPADVANEVQAEIYAIREAWSILGDDKLRSGYDASLATANDYMVTRGVRSLFVVAPDGRMAGLITTTDLLGEGPVRASHTRGVKRHELTVGDVMTPAADIRVTSSSPDAPSDQTNICHKAATLLREHCSVSGGVHIHIDKQVPVGAGNAPKSQDRRQGCDRPFISHEILPRPSRSGPRPHPGPHAGRRN